MHHFRKSSTEQGAALVVGLFILLVLTMIGVAGMQTTVQEEKMAGNARDYNAAFQAAEAGLLEGEGNIETMVTFLDFANDTPGYLDELDSVDDTANYYTDYATWSTSNSPLKYILASDPNSYVLNPNNPRLIIKKLADGPGSRNRSLNIVGYSGAMVQPPVTKFRVTSRATGSTDGSQVILQSFYGKRF